MIKPYNLSDLLSRIILITSSTPKNHLETKEKKQGLRGLIAKYIIDMGMTTNVLGYPYCVEAVYILINSKHRCSIVKDIYTAVADKYNTTPECVESAIRKAIHRIFLLNTESGAAFPGHLYHPAWQPESCRSEKSPGNISTVQ